MIVQAAIFRPSTTGYIAISFSLKYLCRWALYLLTTVSFNMVSSSQWCYSRSALKTGGEVPIFPALSAIAARTGVLSFKRTSLTLVCMTASVSVDLQIFPNLPDDSSPISNLSRGSAPSRKGASPKFNKPDHEPISTSEPCKNSSHPDDCYEPAALLDAEVEASSKV